MNIAGMTVYYASDLHNFGITVDGEEFIGEMFYVEVENTRGDRWRLNRTFPGVRVEQGEEGKYFLDNRPQAEFFCDTLVNAIAFRGRINLDEWHQARPAYGSEAYTAYGQAEDVQWEREQRC